MELIQWHFSVISSYFTFTFPIIYYNFILLFKAQNLLVSQISSVVDCFGTHQINFEDSGLALIVSFLNFFFRLFSLLAMCNRLQTGFSSALERTLNITVRKIHIVAHW